MKTLLLVAFALLWAPLAASQIYTESFETDGNTTRYTLSDGQFSDGSGDYLVRTDGVTAPEVGALPTSLPTYANFDGFYIAGEDLDGDGTPATQSITLASVDVTGVSPIRVEFKLAATQGGWDESDYIAVDAQLDGGAFVQIGAFRLDVDEPDQFNGTLRRDVDNAPTADAARGERERVTTTARPFSFTVPGTGAALVVRLRYSANSGGEEFAYDDVTVTGERTSAQAVYDGPGWRLLSAPVFGLTVTDLAALNLVQGVPAGTPSTTYPAQYPDAGDNLFTGYNGTGTATGFTPPADTDDPIVPGRGFFWYWYDVDTDPAPGGTSTSEELSTFILAASGSEATAHVQEDFNETADGFYLLGNPFADALYLFLGSIPDPSDDAIATSVGTISSSFYAYDPSAASGAGAYEVLSSGQEFPDALQPWQGVFAQITGTGGSNPEITYDADAVFPFFTNVDFYPFYGRRSPEARVALALDGTLASGAPVGDRTALLRLLSDAETRWDRHDLSELVPPQTDAALLALVGERDGTPHRQGVLSLPTTPDAARTIPVAFQTSGAGTFAVSWEASVLPEGWSAHLRDRVTAETLDLSQAGSHAFTADATDWTDRFEIDLAASVVASEPGATTEARVGNPYPNPTAGTARLTVDLASAEAVQVTVVDALGRIVAVAFDAELAAGPRGLSLDTGRLAPGVYAVQVAGQTFTATRRLVVTR